MQPLKLLKRLTNIFFIFLIFFVMLADQISLIWDIKNIDEPTKSSINKYIQHGFGKIDGYLKTLTSKTASTIILKVQLEKKGKNNYVWSLFFDFPGVLKNIEVNIDENTPEEWIPQIVADLFDKTKNALSKQIDKMHDKRS